MNARVADVANELHTSFSEFKNSTKAEIEQVRDAIDETNRRVGRLTVGGAGDDGQSDKKLAMFNAALREKHGTAAAPLNPREFSNYTKAVSAYFRHGQGALDNLDVRAALSVGSDPAGGYLVIDDKDPMPREKLFRTSPMRAVASVITVTGGAYEGLLEDGDFGFGWVGENDTRDETDTGTLAQFTIAAQELFALVPVTQRLIDDAAIDIAAYVTGRVDRRFQRGENAAFAVGDGNLKPRGFLDYRTTATTQADGVRSLGVLQYVPTGAAGAFPTVSGSTASDVGCLYDLKAALHSELRAGAVWAMNSTTFATVEKLKDADGNSLIRRSLDTATPERLLGYPVVIMEDMPDVASDSFSIAFGNFETGYQIVEKPGVRVLRDPFTTKGRVKFYAYKRVGGDVVNSAALKLLKFAAS